MHGKKLRSDNDCYVPCCQALTKNKRIIVVCFIESFLLLLLKKNYLPMYVHQIFNKSAKGEVPLWGTVLTQNIEMVYYSAINEIKLIHSNVTLLFVRIGQPDQSKVK